MGAVMVGRVNVSKATPGGAVMFSIRVLGLIVEGMALVARWVHAFVIMGFLERNVMFVLCHLGYDNKTEKTTSS